MENLEVENDTSDTMHNLRNLSSRQPVHPHASMERMDQNKGIVTLLSQELVPIRQTERQTDRRSCGIGVQGATEKSLQR